MIVNDKYRLATKDEIELYSNGYEPLMDEVLKLIRPFGKELFLTGGTALTKCYNSARLSYEIELSTKQSNLQLLGKNLAIRMQEQGFQFKINQMYNHFIRFFINEFNLTVKMDINSSYNHFGDLNFTNDGYYVNNLNDIGAEKLSSFQENSEIKDIIDLFQITKKIALNDLYKVTDNKKIPLNYDVLLNIHQNGIQGKALLKENINAFELQDFVEYMEVQTEYEVNNITNELMSNKQEVDFLIKCLLWDFPSEDRYINQSSMPILKRRIQKISLPQRRVIEKILV